MAEYPQPGGEQRSQQHFIIFDRFKGLNTQSARTGLPNDQVAWLENLQPLADNKLQVVPAPAPPSLTGLAGTIALEFYAAMNNQDWLILFTTTGAGLYYNITTGNSGQFAPVGTFSTAPDCTTWQAERILINDSIAGYCTWDGTLFVRQGGVSPNIEVTNGGVNYLVAPTVTITTAQAGSGATAVATVANGKVVGVQLTNPGANFQAGDDVFVAFSSLGGSGATFNVVMTTSNLNAVLITSAGQWGPGNGPAAGFYALVISGGGGSGAAATAQVSFNAALNAFYVSNVSVTVSGSGYTSNPSVSWNFGAFPIAGAGPFFSPVMNFQSVASVSVSAGGSGYPPSATMSLIFSGGSGSPQATGTATSNSSGVVTGASGAGGSYPFLGRPSVAVAQGSGAAAAAHVWPFVTPGTTLAVFQGRVFLGGGQLLQWSGTGATAGYNKQGFDDFLVADLSGALGISDADLVHNITALRAFNNYLWVVGDQSIKQIGSLFPSGAPPFQLLTLSSDQGTIWPKSCISYNRIFLFANPNGIFGVFGSTVQKISDDLDGIFQNANFSQQPQGAVVDLNSKHNAVFLVRYVDPQLGTRSLLLVFDGKRWWLGNQGNSLAAIVGAPLFATDVNQLWGSVTGTDITRLFADPTTAQPFKLSTALAHADNPVQGKRLMRAGFTADASSAGQVSMLLEADQAPGVPRALAVTAGTLLVGGANDANNAPLSITGIYLGATLTGTLANFILQNAIFEYQETALWKGGVSGAPPQPPVIKLIKTDFGALERTAVPNPATNFGGSRFYGLGGLTSAPLNPVFVAVEVDLGSQTTVNFGATPFVYTPPAGFSAWGAATTLDPNGARCVLTNGNLTASTSGVFSVAKSTTSKLSGKLYIEATINTLPSASASQAIGVWSGSLRDPSTTNLGKDDLSIACYDDGTVYFGVLYPQGLTSDGRISYGIDEKDYLESPFAVNDVISMAIDVDNSKIWMRRNGGAWKFRGTCQAFGEFHVFAQKQTVPVLLDMEGGDYLVIGFDMGIPFSAIKQLTVKGTGARFTVQANRAMDLGAHGGFPNASFFNGRTDTLAVRLNPVAPGDIVLNVASPLRTISTGAVTDFFLPGDWCCLDALELQGHAGYPPNQYNCEYVQLKAVNNTQITLTAPVIGAYSDQYPDRYTGVADLYDPGGAATLHKMIRAGMFTPVNSWDIDITINDLTIDCSASASVVENNISGRKFTLNNMTWISSEPNFSQSQRYTVKGGTIGGFVEVDKSVQFLDVASVTFTGSVQFQSASIQEATFTSCIFQQKLLGQAKVMTLANCTIAEAVQGLNLGNSYGQGRTLSLTNVTAPVVSNVSGQYLQTQADPVFTYANGVFTSNPSAVWTIAVPGLGFLGAISRTFMQAFKILSVTKTSDNRTVVTTDLPYATLPSVPAVFGGPGTPRIWWHPCPSISCSGCGGSPHLVEWNDAYAQGKPIYSYLKRTCTRDTNSYRVSNDGQTDLWGALVSISINVTRAYTGAQPNAFFVPNWVDAISPDLATQVKNTISDPTYMKVNTKIAGERIITPTTITGAQSGDAFPAPFPRAFQFMESMDSFLVDAGGSSVNLSGDPAAATPIVVLTIKTNQSSPFS